MEQHEKDLRLQVLQEVAQCQSLNIDRLIETAKQMNIVLFAKDGQPIEKIKSIRCENPKYELKTQDGKMTLSLANPHFDIKGFQQTYWIKSFSIAIFAKNNGNFDAFKTISEFVRGDLAFMERFKKDALNNMQEMKERAI